METKQQIIDKVSQYIHWLSIPKKEFNNIAVCPFIQRELEHNQLYWDIWYPDLKSLMSLIEQFIQSDKNSALFICQDTHDINWEQVDRKTIQKQINNMLRSNPNTNYLKSIVISPWENFAIAGVETRKKAPYFMINLTPTEQLGKAHKDLQKTKYYDNFTDKDRKLMKVKPK
tara:strand:+ start:1145 stop:1660 length:516 start_codon:yes stop_codon:yes gene_type:complete